MFNQYLPNIDMSKQITDFVVSLVKSNVSSYIRHIAIHK